MKELEKERKKWKRFLAKKTVKNLQQFTVQDNMRLCECVVRMCMLMYMFVWKKVMKAWKKGFLNEEKELVNEISTL